MKKRYWIPALIILALVVTYFLGPPPPEPTYTNVMPEVPTSPAMLEAYIAKKETARPLREDNEARIRWHEEERKKTEYALVYLHGFAGSYQDGYPVNVQLADTFAANIYLARYAGHGLQPPASMVDFSPETAWADAREALAIGRAIGEKVILMSTSTGGTLAALLAAHFPDLVHATINIGPNYKDDIPGTWMLNSNWGFELSHLISLGQYREVTHEKARANQYWDTMYVAEALYRLQTLVSAMEEPLFNKITCPVLTMYYHKNDSDEDERVEVSVYPKLHKALGTPQEMVRLIALPTPETHFAGSEIMSKDIAITRETAVAFCREVLKM